MKSVFWTLLVVAPLSLLANNIQVTNVGLADQDVNANTIKVTFDLSWDNSWRINSGPSNWDAAWVFVKYRTYGGSWKHLKLNYVDGTNDGHFVPSQALIRTMSDQTGCFVYRAMEGSGDFSVPGVELLWDYGAESLADDASIEIKVFALEMVYVPQAEFSLGNGLFSNEIGRFYRVGNPFSTSYTVSSEGEITVGTSVGNLYYSSSGNSGDQLGPIPADYPKGYNAFYCMKYEVSQGQYVDFFNTLTETQRTNRDITNAQHKNTDEILGRNAISYTSFRATTDYPDIPLNYVSTIDALAYLDWSGLRPMSEMEFEKACRGTNLAVINEFAWGSTEIAANEITLSNEGTGNELVSNRQPEEPGISYGPTNNLGGPLRCGIFAASAINKTRTESGATFYGIMEMSGNLFERTVSAGSPDGRAFTGLHGDGVLTAVGEDNVANWPGPTGGLGYRGGSFSNTSLPLRMADRNDAANTSNVVNSSIGFRGVRTPN